MVQQVRADATMAGADIADATPDAATQFGDMRSAFRHAARASADRPAVIYFDRTLTYAELDRASDALAAWLHGKGIGQGDRVAIILQNMPQFVMMAVATWKVGGVPVPGNPMYRPPEIARILDDCKPRAVLCEHAHVEALQAALAIAGLQPALLSTDPAAFQSRYDPRVLGPTSPSPADGETLETVVAAGGSPPEPEAIDGDNIGLVLYTSGTTGLPKGAMIRHRSLAFNGEGLGALCGLSPISRILAIAPFFHITGFACHLAAAICTGATMILQYRVEPSLLLDVIREHRPSFTICAITVFNALMNVPGATAEDMTCFDRVYSGGAPIPPALHAEIHARLGLYIHPAYGMTETTAQTHAAPFGERIPVHKEAGALSIGKLVPGTAARILGEDGGTLGPGDPGELLLRGPQIMAGYWDKQDESRAALAGGWMHTGDVAFYDEDGWFYLVDRIKDVIIASGFKIWPREVEDVLYAHPAVREAAVVGVADPYRGETVKAFVALKQDGTADAAALIAHCRETLAAYKVPRLVEFLPDLPKTVTGKIQRLALREPPSGRQV